MARAGYCEVNNDQRTTKNGLRFFQPISLIRNVKVYPSQGREIDEGVVQMKILSLKTCADYLGISTRKLRYFLAKEEVIPYRQLDLGGGTHVRFFTVEDLQSMKDWWKENHAEDSQRKIIGGKNGKRNYDD
jgi:hypothetical protein